VQGIEAAKGRMGDTTNKNSSTSEGKKIHVDTCVAVNGVSSPLVLLGRRAVMVIQEVVLLNRWKAPVEMNNAVKFDRGNVCLSKMNELVGNLRRENSKKAFL
jgi:hypothetical protein